MLECDEGEVETQLNAIQGLVELVAGTVGVTEVTSTCLALVIDVPDAAMPCLKAGLKLGARDTCPRLACKGQPACCYYRITPLRCAQVIGANP